MPTQRDAEMPNQRVAEHWLAYFTAFYSTAVKPLCKRIDRILVRWAMNKYKRLKRSVKRAREWLRMVRKRAPRLFAHWELPY
jgi:RNA-directed DNA polymerase